MPRPASLAAALLTIVGCVDAKHPRRDADAAPVATETSRAEDDAAHDAPPEQDEGPPRELLTIPSGSVHAGSSPGTPGRVPSAEMDGVPFEMHEFEMERGVRPQRGLSREQAEAVCRGDERRLCTELEWEWACEGEAHRDAAHRRSPFGVVGLGEQREWTASAWGTTDADRAEGFAIRGAPPDAPESARRCAARMASSPAPSEDGAAPPDTGTSDVAFRCCSGDPNEAAVTLEPSRGTFFPIDLPADKFAAVVRSIPELSEVHDAPVEFSERDVEAATTRPGSGPPEQGWRFGAGPLLWTPERGDQLVVLLGHTRKHSFVAVLYRLPGDRFRHAASLILRDDVTPLTLAWGALRREIRWTPCWLCGDTEGGKIVYRLESFDVRVTH